MAVLMDGGAGLQDYTAIYDEESERADREIDEWRRLHTCADCRLFEPCPCGCGWGCCCLDDVERGDRPVRADWEPCEAAEPRYSEQTIWE